jgi:hypothetical protein
MQACPTHTRPIRQSTSPDYCNRKGHSPHTTGPARKCDSVILPGTLSHSHVLRTKHMKPPRSPSSDTAYDTSDDDTIGPISPSILHKLSIYLKGAKNRPKPYHRCSPNIIEHLYGEEGYNDSKYSFQGVCQSTYLQFIY